MQNGNKVMEEERTTLEKCLIAALIFCMVLTLGLAAGLAYYAISFYATKQAELCSTAECIKAANDLLDSIDTSVDPCQDFFSFSCGKWMKNTVRMAGEVDHFTELNDYFLKRVKEMLEQDNDIHAEHFTKAKTFYTTCMNGTNRENISTFLNDLKYFGGWPMLEERWNDTDWMTITQKLFVRGYNSDVAISSAIVRDYGNNTFNRLQFDQPNLGLKQKEYYDRNIGNETMMDYQEFVWSVAKELASQTWQPDVDNITMEIRNAVEIEITLAEMSHSLKFYTNISNVYHLMKFSELQTQTPELDWNRYLRIFLNETIPPEEMVIVSDIVVIQNITKYLSALNSTYEGRRSLANYMIYRTALDAAEDLNRELSRIHDDHKEGVTESWKKCVSSTVEQFEISLLAVYQKKYFNEQKRIGIVALVDELKHQLAKVLTETEWMDKKTRAAAIAKVTAIAVVAAFPDDFRNDTKVNQWYKEFEIGSNHLQNVLNGNLYLVNKLIASYRLRVDEKDWLYLPDDITDTNAYYVPNSNEIFISIGISSDFYFNENNPMYINYGRMGTILGHELTHSIDQTGALYDSKGNWRNWWKKETLHKYYKESECIVNQFNKYVDNTTGLTIRGKFTLVETTADNVGVREAYHAYLNYAKNHKVLSLPALPYNPNQLFWIAYATFWCEKNSMEYLQYLILFDEHPPSNLRVLGTLSNNAEFAKDFGCELGTRMHPSNDKCTIFGKR